MKKQIDEQFVDESGDKTHFTIIPNFIADTYSAIESGVYTYIKKRAGESGTFFETQITSCKKLKIERHTYSKILKKLEIDKKIAYAGKKLLKTHPVNVYKILNIWKENIEFYSKRYGKNNTLSLNKEKRYGKNNAPCNGKNNASINNQSNNNQESIISISNGNNRAEQSSAEVKNFNSLIGLFQNVNPSYQKLFGNISQRKALERLIAKLGYDQISKAIEMLPIINEQKYAPVITTPIQLEDKLGQLIIFVKKQRNETVKGGKKIL